MSNTNDQTTAPAAEERPGQTTEEAQPPQEHEEPQEGQEDQEQGKPAREAAKYRRRLRETETERDTLAAQLQAMQKAEVERLASGDIAKPGALWAAGAKLEDMLNDDGTVSPSKTRAAINAAAETLGLQRPGTSRSAAPHGKPLGGIDEGPDRQFAYAFRTPSQRRREDDAW